MTKEMTAAERYARLKADQFEAFLDSSFTDEALKDVQLYEVKAESGMVFKCRKLDSAFMSNTGSMPMALTETIITENAAASEDEMRQRFEQLSDTQKRAGIQATAQMIRYICVEPRLVIGEVGKQTNAISVDVLTMADFNSLAEWAKTGGGAAAGLKTFRRKRR